VVGDGSARAALERAAEPLGDRLLLAGRRPLSEVPLWMAASHALVLPSWAEGTPNVVLEALACGRRVVATSVGGVPDHVPGPGLGELVPPRRADLLSAALERAADASYDPARVAEAGARGGWDESARSLEASLRSAMA
jgi:glycosyltransferase involved in cell wall biosynthesis